MERTSAAAPAFLPFAAARPAPAAAGPTLPLAPFLATGTPFDGRAAAAELPGAAAALAEDLLRELF